MKAALGLQLAEALEKSYSLSTQVGAPLKAGVLLAEQVCSLSCSLLELAGALERGLQPALGHAGGCPGVGALGCPPCRPTASNRCQRFLR